MIDRKFLGRRDMLRKGGALGAGGLLLIGGTAPLMQARAADSRHDLVNIVNTSGNSTVTLQAMIKSLDYMGQFGVNANFVNIADGSKIMGALISGNSDITTSAGFAQVFPAIEKGGKVKLVAGALMTPVHAMYTKRDNIRSVKDLVGKTIGSGSPGSLLYVETVALLRKKGVDEKSVTFVNVGSNASVLRAVSAGVVDAGLSEVDYFYQQDKFGIHSLTDGNLWTELPEFTFQAAYASDEAIRTKRDALVRTLAAFAKLYRYAQSPESKQAFFKARAEGMGKDDPEEALVEWNFYRDNHSYAVDLLLSEERVNYMQKLNQSLGVQKTIMPFNQVADMSLARDALKLLA